MQSNVLSLLIGAGLVSIGVLIAALAERLRNSRPPRERELSTRTSRTREASVLPVVEHTELLRPTTTRTPHSRAESKTTARVEGGEDVVAALVAAGYKRAVAAEATWGCSAAERATLERWTTAALRRCVS